MEMNKADDSPAESSPNTPSATVPQNRRSAATQNIPALSLGPTRDLEKTRRRYDTALAELERGTQRCWRSLGKLQNCPVLW